MTNHMGSISHHIMALVINSLGGGHTHTNTHTDIRRQNNSKKPSAQRPKKYSKLWCVVHTYYTKLQILTTDGTTQNYAIRTTDKTTCTRNTHTN